MNSILKNETVTNAKTNVALFPLTIKKNNK